MKTRAKKLAFFALKLSVSGTLLYVVLERAGISEVASLLGNISPYIFASAVLIYLSALFVASIRWSLLLPRKFSLKRLYPLYLLGSFFNTFLPGLVGGDAVKIYYLYRETGDGSQALSSVFMDRYIGFASMMSLGLMAFPFGFSYMKGTWIVWILPAIITAFIAASFIIFGLRVGKRFKVLHSLYEYFHEYRKKYPIIAKAFVLSLILQVSIICAIYILSLGLGLDVPFVTLLIFIPIITTVSTIPISLAGIGLREAASVVLFGSIGFSADAATAISFAWFLTMATGGLTGLYEYLREKDYDKKH